MPVDQPCNIYWEQLFPLGYGHALWEPNPIEYFYDQVSIGDVGYVMDGFFHRMFNVTLPSDDPSNQRYDVPPPPYKPLDIGPNIRRSILAKGFYYSNSVCTQSNYNDPSATSSDDLEVFTYKCTGHGALLCLPHDGHREDAICARLFKDYIRDNVESWFEWSKKRGLDTGRIEDLILVSGRTLVTSWGAAVFLDHGKEETAISLAVHTLPNGGGKFVWRLINRLVPHRNSPVEPSDNSSSKLNQCVFIKGFRAKRGFPWFKRIRAAAEPLPDDPDDSHEDEMQVTGIPDTPEYRDPLVGILDYVAKKCPEDAMAIVHNDDLQLVENVGALTADGVEQFLHENEIPVVVEDGVASLRNRHGDVTPVRDDPQAKLRGKQAHSCSSPKPGAAIRAHTLSKISSQPTHEPSSLFVANAPVPPYNRDTAPAANKPPPATAATCAKEARESQGDGMTGRYSPPALCALVSDGPPPKGGSPATTVVPSPDNSSPSTNTYTPGYRRARAGTLPSNLSLAAQQYAASTPSPRTLTSTEFFNEQLHLFPQPSDTPPAPMRPTPRHSAWVAAPAATSVLAERSSHLCSGSSTTHPPTGLSTPYGSASLTLRRRSWAFHLPPQAPPPSQPIPNPPILDTTATSTTPDGLQSVSGYDTPISLTGSMQNLARPAAASRIVAVADFPQAQARHTSPTVPATLSTNISDRLTLSPRSSQTTHERSRPSSGRSLQKALEFARSAVKLDSTGDDPHGAAVAYGKSVALLREVMERAINDKDSNDSVRRRGGRRRSVVAQEEEVRRLKAIHDTYAERMNILSLIYSIPPPPHSPSAAPSVSTPTDSTRPSSPDSPSSEISDHLRRESSATLYDDVDARRFSQETAKYRGELLEQGGSSESTCVKNEGWKERKGKNTSGSEREKRERPVRKDADRTT